MRPKTVGAAWENGNRGTPRRGPLRQLGLRQFGLRQAGLRQAGLRQLALRQLALLALILGLVGCGIRPTDPIPGLEAPSGPRESTLPALYWVSEGKAIAVSRPPGSVTGYDVVALLAQGPTGDEQNRGLTTEVPFDVAPAIVDRVANGLDVTISTDVSLLSQTAVQQIVCTLLGIQPVGTVNLHGGGHSLESLKCA